MPLRMESVSPEKIGWTYVKNSVKDRMVDDSMVHRLAPARKLHRRTKLFNAVLKKLGPMTRYDQYVKIKTMILRNISQDNETDDEDDAVLTIDDYSSLYNSDELKTHTTTDFDDSVNRYCKEIRRSIIVSKRNKACVSEGGKRRSSERQAARKSQSKETSLSKNVEQETCSRVEDVLQSILGGDISPLAELKKDEDTSRIEESKESEKSSEKKIVLNNESQREEESVDEQSVNATQLPRAEGEGAPGTNIEIKKETSVKKTPKLNINNGSEKMSIERQHLYRKARRNLTSVLENISDTYVMEKGDHINNEEDQEIDSIADCNPMGQSTPLYPDTMYQPKDSGIDEDSQEEFSGDVKYNARSMKINRKNNINVCLNDSPPYTTVQRVYEKLDMCDKTVNNVDFNDTPVKKEEAKTIREENKGEKLYKHELPKVICTEVVSKQYRIIREGQSEETSNSVILEYNTLPNNTRKTRNENDVNDDDKQTEKSQLEESVCSDKNISNCNDGYTHRYTDYDYSEDADDEENNPISPSTTKRLQQLKRLNLTADDVSSSSDENNETYSTKNSKVRLSTINDVRYKESSGKPKKKKKNRDDGNKENSCQNTEGNITDENSRINETSRREEQSPVRRSIVSKRPHHLQEFIDEEELIDEAAASTFTLKDVDNEDEVYVLNIPSTMLSSDLEGKKMVLKETKVRFGKDRYRISYRGEDNLSCVMSTGKRRKPYKTVRVRVNGVITVREKIPRLIASTDCSDSVCDSSFSHNETMEIPGRSLTKKRELEKIAEDSEETPRKKRIRSS